MNVDHRKEILFYYQSIEANPNGDPGFDDQPREMSDRTIMVTDLRLTQTCLDSFFQCQKRREQRKNLHGTA